MPKELAMILSITVRFLFVFIDELTTIRNAQNPETLIYIQS